MTKSGLNEVVEQFDRDASSCLQSAPAIIERVRETCLHIVDDGSPPIITWSEFSERMDNLGVKLQQLNLKDKSIQKVIGDALEKLGVILLLKSYLPI